MTDERESGEHDSVKHVKNAGGPIRGALTALAAAILSIFGVSWEDDENDDHHETKDG